MLVQAMLRGRTAGCWHSMMIPRRTRCSDPRCNGEHLFRAKFPGHFLNRHRENRADNALLAGIGKCLETVCDGAQSMVKLGNKGV